MDDMCYVGRKPCGCCRAAVVDAPSAGKEVIKTEADFVRQGMIVEHVTLDRARELLAEGTGCRHGKNPPTGQQIALF